MRVGINAEVFVRNPIPTPPPTLYDIVFKGLTFDELVALRQMVSTYEPWKPTYLERKQMEVAIDAALPDELKQKIYEAMEKK